MKLRVVLVLAVSLLVLPGSSAAGVRVWFEARGAPIAVNRNGKTIQQAVEMLLAGPTAAERTRGVQTFVPPRTPLRSITVSRRIVTVDLGGRFAAGRDEQALHGRVGQLVRTVRSISGVLGVLVRVEGGVPVGLFPGWDLRVAVAAVPPQPIPTTRYYQQQLVDLGFLDASGLTGVLDSQTATAVLGFQKWANLPRDGALGAGTTAALRRAARPEPRLRRSGRRVEIQLRRQLALLIENNRVLRTVHISSGAGGLTPRGSFRVYRKERFSWSVPFKVWLPWASYFTGGIAMHEYSSVPAYPASHGCVRVNRYDAKLLFSFAEAGTPVDVIDEASA